MQKLKTIIPDEKYYLSLINCREACPVNTDSGAYVRAVFEENDFLAYKIASSPNPLASICGRICAHPCEEACRRGKIDSPIRIRALKRFVCEKYGAEALRIPRKTPLAIKKTKGKIAIIGAGPSGLSCANEISKLGYEATIFEASPVFGGMLHLGIPEYRLPREVINAEVNKILSLNTEFIFNTKLGKDFNLSDLFNSSFNTVYLGIGAMSSREFSIEGIDYDGVINGIDFLLNVNLGFKVELGKKILVIGGGNVALDVARTAIRSKISFIEGDFDIANHLRYSDGLTWIDMAKIALRIGSGEVSIICLESEKGSNPQNHKEEIPAFSEEIEDASSEGIKFYYGWGVSKILGINGKVSGASIIKVKSVYDDRGKFCPSFVKGSEKIIEADTIILAIGQKPDLSFAAFENIETTNWGTIKVNDDLSTSKKGVYAGGDCVFGPRNVIFAINDGKRAALSIDKFLSKKNIDKNLKGEFRKISWQRYKTYYDKIKRFNLPAIDINKRIGFKEVELPFDSKEAKNEAERCLVCHVNPVFDSEKCILCGGCVDICPYCCLEIRKSNEIEIFDCKLDEQAYAIIKDEEKCTRCGLCAEKCPVKAITMEKFEYSYS